MWQSTFLASVWATIATNKIKAYANLRISDGTISKATIWPHPSCMTNTEPNTSGQPHIDGDWYDLVLRTINIRWRETTPLSKLTVLILWRSQTYCHSLPTQTKTLGTSH
jgi:hypothetical protein